MALGLFAYLKTIERKVCVTEIKLNKATTLLNSIKIKYVNAANVLDYQCNKYYIKMHMSWSRNIRHILR